MPYTQDIFMLTQCYTSLRASLVAGLKKAILAPAEALSQGCVAFRHHILKPGMAEPKTAATGSPGRGCLFSVSNSACLTYRQDRFAWLA